MLVRDATIHTAPGKVHRGDLRVSGPVIAEDDVSCDDTTIIEASGCSVVPLLVDTVFAASPPAPDDSFDLTPGRPATFAVIQGSVGVSAIRSMLVVSPRDLEAVVVHGQQVVRHGAPRRPAGTDDLSRDSPRLGAWTDSRRDMTQYLSPDGRYSETRGGRRDAYTGSFWLDDDRITYLDDTGFWAFGQYHRGILHHAGFVLHRAGERAGPP
ncbi:hypothetical protein GCM10009718_16370 [Isoptericola halotolerans]|uniref:Ligand-binding protein with streptavidin-like fold n=1 Tax=Isoptericola halotolerans TaxID=300560 RepID=A0ABX2A7D3_9MICO|nr:Atu4866 domain-containing protein [Isoptericola halotolerans]NOV98789.1 hypothetical protein [Isoptericola halotolerans]